MPNFLTTLTATNANNATIRNVIKATKKSPTANGPTIYVPLNYPFPGSASRWQAAADLLLVLESKCPNTTR